jgi:CRP-like cAMP-binding protein
LLLRKLQLHSPLSEEDREAVLALPYSLKTLEPHTYTVREGDPPVACAVLLSGFAYRQKVTADGLAADRGPPHSGRSTGFPEPVPRRRRSQRPDADAGGVAFIPRAALQELARTRSGVGHAILVTILVEASIFREWVLNVGRRDSRTRVAHLLCEFAVRLEALGLADEYGYELPMTQEQLADATGLTPVHINRTLKALQAEGLIVRNKRKVSFPDWTRMRSVGDFNQRYLHLEPQRSGAGK